jgi:hypothetical protein
MDVKTGGKKWRVKKRYLCHQVGLDSFIEPRSSHPQIEPFSKEMRLKIPHLGRGMKMSNHKLCFWVSALHVFCEILYLPPMASRHRALADQCFFSFLFQDLPMFHCGDANRGLKSSRNLRTPGNDHVHIYSLWFMVTSGTSFGVHNHAVFAVLVHSLLLIYGLHTFNFSGLSPCASFCPVVSMSVAATSPFIFRLMTRSIAAAHQAGNLIREILSSGDLKVEIKVSLLLPVALNL